MVFLCCGLNNVMALITILVIPVCSSSVVAITYTKVNCQPSNTNAVGTHVYAMRVNPLQLWMIASKSLCGKYVVSFMFVCWLLRLH